MSRVLISFQIVPVTLNGDSRHWDTALLRRPRASEELEESSGGCLDEKHREGEAT